MPMTPFEADTRLAQNGDSELPMLCSAQAQAMMHKEACKTSPAVSQLLFGETFHVESKKTDWVFGYASLDRYRGWVQKKSCCPRNHCPRIASMHCAQPYFHALISNPPLPIICPLAAWSVPERRKDHSWCSKVRVLSGKNIAAQLNRQIQPIGYRVARSFLWMRQASARNL